MRRLRWRATAGVNSDGEPPIVNIRFQNLGLTLKKNGKRILSGVCDICTLQINITRVCFAFNVCLTVP